MPVSSAEYVGAYNVYDDGNVVGATARCSCGIGSYSYQTAYFVDECPACGGNLYFEQGDYSGADYTSPEGLWACSRCDRDYCAQCGKIHDSSGYWLYSASKPQPKPDVSKKEIAEKQESPTPWMIAQKHIKRTVLL